MVGGRIIANLEDCRSGSPLQSWATGQTLEVRKREAPRHRRSLLMAVRGEQVTGRWSLRYRPTGSDGSHLAVDDAGHAQVVGCMFMMSRCDPRVESLVFSGYRLVYRVAGTGPALVLIKPHRAPKEYVQLRLLADRYTMIQIDPLGFGSSDKPSDYPLDGVDKQVKSVLDQEGIGKFAIWGYSQGAAMAATVARANSEVVSLVAGGYPLILHPTEAQKRRSSNDPRLPVAAREFWSRYYEYEWDHELARLECPKLCYVGTADRTWAPPVRRVSEELARCGFDVVELDGLDHQTCNSEPAVSTQVAPRVVEWLTRCLPAGW